MEITKSSVLEMLAKWFSDDNKISQELGEVKATLMVNFGPEGKVKKDCLKGDESAMWMLVKVCEKYQSEIDQLNKQKNLANEVIVKIAEWDKNKSFITMNSLERAVKTYSEEL